MRANHEIDGRQRWKELDSYDFAQTPFQLVAIDRGVAVSRNHDSHARMPERGSEASDVEMTTPNSLPPSNDSFQVAFARQAKLARKVDAVVRRLRICLGGAPSGASAPFSGDDSKPGVPISWPCARGSRACECGACYGDGMWACPSTTPIAVR